MLYSKSTLLALNFINQNMKNFSISLDENQKGANAIDLYSNSTLLALNFINQNMKNFSISLAENQKGTNATDFLQQ